MIDQDALNALFRKVILACFPLIAACGEPSTGAGQECPTTRQHREFTLSGLSGTADGGAGDGGIADLIAQCQASPASCGPLCQSLVPRSSELPPVAPGPPVPSRCELVTADGGEPTLVVEYRYGCLGGRRPGGLCPVEPTPALDGVGAWLAANAHMEAASVDAFIILAGELDAHRAPSALSRAARAAADDERRHARAMRRLCGRWGASVPAVRLAATPERSLEAMAQENAIEGCVKETFAALLARGQARAAGDGAIRGAMGAIATDELRHAALSWAVDRWVGTRLSAAARHRVREARREAAEEVVRAATASVTPEAGAVLGLPDAGAAVAMARALRDQLWRA